ncbi:MAG: AAA family ATPase, partial [Bradymonadaceae bacterium]
MKLSFTVGLRSYGENLFIGQTLGLPRVSAAGGDREDVLDKLEEELRHALGHSHPRMLMEISEPISTSLVRAVLPVTEDGEAKSWSVRPMTIDVIVERHRGELSRVIVPLYHLATWAKGDPLSGELDLDAVMKEIAQGIAPYRQEWMVERPRPDAFEILEMEVEFEPLDLSRVAGDLRWKDFFESEELLDDKTERGVPTPTLDEVAQRWAGVTRDGKEEPAAHFFAPFYGRDEKLEELENLLDGAGSTPVVLVGPSRVGKTALIKAYAQRVLQRGVGESMRQVFFADPPRLCAADPFSAGWQQQCGEICRELEASESILYIGRISEALDAGKYVGSEYNLAQFLKPWLADRRLRFVGEATVEEWNKVEERDVGFASTFTVIRLEEAEDAKSLDIVQKSAAYWSRTLAIEMGR